ncbi:MAG: serine--tRNA ligase [Chitinispirillaceae bacterium]|jgi:seryl-tRNA synthetase
MLDIQRIRDFPEEVRQATVNKRSPIDIAAILALDAARRETIREVERLKNLRNSRSQEIAALKKNGQDVTALLAEMRQVAETVKELDTRQAGLDEKLHEELIKIPNVPHSSVHHGESEKDNKEIKIWGAPRTFDFEPKDHLRLGDDLDIIDFPRGAKVAGTGFPVYKGAGALLERALLNFMLDTHTVKNGYREIFPPFLVNEQSAFGTGQLPKSREQMYYVNEDGLFCVPTAEVPVTNLHRDEILDAGALPIKYCAYTACFRREAGSYGKDTKGFLRVHQFNKVELVKFTFPENSYEELERLRHDAEGILQALGLHYRVLALCDADLSFAAAKCFDLEAWAPAEKKFLEVSSCSNFEDFQARRMNIRYRPAAGERLRFIHTLNGSGLATARIFAAILETYQTAAGTVLVPEVLQPYMHGMKEIGSR